MADYTVSVNLVANDNASQAVKDLNKALQGVGEETEKQKNKTSEQVSGWQQYTDAIKNAEVALGTVQMAVGMLGQGLEFVDMGENVHAVSLAFQALQGDAATAANTLQTVRDATSGVLDDVSIMSATNRLQSMGLADTADEFGELIGMAQQLGSVMSPGATAAQNIDNFTLLLANQSVRRLDSFGISADAVRQRIEELKEAGMSAQEAFNVATLEQGRIALANLGDAATAGATNVDRLSTAVQNGMNRFAEFAAGVTNDAVTTLQQLVFIFDYYSDQLDAAILGTGTQPEYGEFQGAADASQQYLTDNVAGYATQPSTREADERAAIQTQMALDQSAQDAARHAQELIDSTIAAKDAAKDLEDQWALVAGAMSNEGGINEAIIAAKDATKELSDGWDTMRGSVSANADEAERMADAAARADISLTSALGTTSGGMGGEIGSDVASQMQAQGMSESDIAAYQQATGLMTGQVTQSSMAYDQEVVPLITNIYNTYGADAAAQATMNLQTGMQNAEMMGLSDQQTAAAMAGMTGYTQQAASAGGFQGLGTDTSGNTVTQTEGFDVDAYTASLSEADTAMASIADSGESFKGAMQTSVTSVNAISTGVEQMGTSLSRTVTQFRSLAGQRVTMRADVEINFANQGMLADFIRSVVGGSTGGGNSEGEHIPGTGSGQ